MPIKTIDLSSAPGFLIDVCLNCGIEHRIRLDRGAVETKAEPFALDDGATLEVSVDGSAPATITFKTADAASLGAAKAAEIVAKLQALGSVQITVTKAATVIIESASVGAASRIEVTGGTARKALGFFDDTADPCPGRPTLGMKSQRTNLDIIAFRRCGCGTHETVNRTWDVAPATLAGTQFYEHRRAVNYLSEHFKKKGWVHPDLAAVYQAEATAPPDTLADGTSLASVPLEK